MASIEPHVIEVGDQIFLFHGVPGPDVSQSDMVSAVLAAAAPHLALLLVPDRPISLTLRQLEGLDTVEFFVDLQVVKGPFQD